MGGKITTHALDLAKGKPAAGMRVELWRLGGTISNPGIYEEGSLLSDIRLNDDGRPDKPLAEGMLVSGVYELRFHAGSYFGQGEPGFLELVPVRFSVTDGAAHYHVPLLVSPGGYSTYRGS
jgi:5-hydroxyisourate hydrolase